MSPKMRVLHVVRPAQGGIRRHVSLLATELARRDIDASIAAPADFRADASVSGAADIPHFPVPIAPHPHPVLDLHAARIVRAFARHAEIVHAHGLRGAWIASLARGKRGTPFVFTAHNLAPPIGRVAGFFLRSVCRRAAAVICVSSAVADSLAPYLGRREAVVVPNGIDLTLFDRLPAKANEDGMSHVVAIGRLSPEKGFDLLVEAAALLPGVRFSLAGEGPERERLAQRIREHDVTDRFALLGQVEDIPALLASADVVTVPSRSEGQGFVAIEAMAAGRPVVASRVGGLVETVVEGGIGLLVAAGDASALADALRELVADEGRRAAFGEAGRKRVEEHYTMGRMVDKVVTVYTALIRSS
jgi:glycosyltransferase involved in cell wall biosynthesis